MADGLRLAALRPEDLLALEFEFINLRSIAGGVLERAAPGEPALVIVHFPPQHIAEMVFVAGSIPMESNLCDTTERSPVSAVMAGPSRLVFRLPDDTIQLPLTLEALLNWDKWQPVVAESTPGELETAIEFPWKLIISPDGRAHWHHQILPVTLDGNTQLWRTDLVRDKILEPGADIRALDSVPGDSSFLNSLLERDRKALVDLTSPAAGSADQRPITSDSFSLSTLGTSARLHGQWPQAASGLTKYEHVAIQGRDQLVIVVRTGFLCSLGHKAAIVATVQRAPVCKAVVGPVLRMGTAAHLIKRMDLFVEEPHIDYGPMAKAYSHDGREMPLKSIQLITLSAQVFDRAYTEPTWILSPDGRPILFKAVARDGAGNQINLEMPMMFVPFDMVQDMRKIGAMYNEIPLARDKARHIDFKGQKLAMADPGKKPGSTEVKVERIELGLAAVGGPQFGFDADLDASQLPSSYPPRYLPFIISARASLPALDELLGSAGAQDISYDETYLNHEFDAATNRGEVFVQLKNTLSIEFPSQRGGGLVRPNTAAKALSRNLGTVSAPGELQKGKIDLSAFSKARFLGTIKLLDIVNQGMPLDAASAAADPPTQQQLDDPGFHLNQPRLITRRLGREGEGVETRFVWKPQLHSLPSGLLTLRLDQAELVLDAVTTRSSSGTGSSVVNGRLRGAELEFKDAVSITMGELLFRAEEGRKMEVGAKTVSLSFKGDLEFVNSLRSILPESGFEDPPFLTVDGQGVVAGYTLGLPSVGVGIFSLQNISLSAALSVPFVDKPAGVRFAISERHKPFLVTVSLFGGGGFFALALSADGLEQVEASIEFGGNISLNLFVASGGVYVMAGIYFGLTAKSVQLTGFLRCGGYLEVLGLISVSVEFYLAFTYRKKSPGGNEVWGQASLKVCIKIAFFSTSVSLSVERKFAGSDGDPSFAETVNARQWTEYLQAFA